MSAAAGWYDDGSGRQRWWDGAQWTEHFADQQTASIAPSVVERLEDPNTMWEAQGKPLSGIGAGRYRLTKEFLFFEKGMLTTKAQQIHTHEIHDVDANQSMTQKARSVGTITLRAVRSTGNAETVLLEDVPDFRHGVAVINRAASEARESLRQRQQTQHIQYSGAIPGVPSATIPAAGSGTTPSAGAIDLNSEIARLAAYRDQGVLDEEEFKAAKAKLLGL